MSRVKANLTKNLFNFHAKNHCVFAGGYQGKGKALKQLIDINAFINNPNNIIFINIETKNTTDIENTFKNESQNLYIYYYPDPKEKLDIEGK